MKKDLRGSTDLTDLQRIRKLRDGSLSVREKKKEILDHWEFGIWEREMKELEGTQSDIYGWFWFGGDAVKMAWEFCFGFFIH